MRPLTAWLEDGYCSITVANNKLITVIRFVSKSYTHPWKGFANRLHLVLHACEILFSENVRKKLTVETKHHPARSLRTGSRSRWAAIVQLWAANQGWWIAARCADGCEHPLSFVLRAASCGMNRGNLRVCGAGQSSGLGSFPLYIEILSYQQI